MHYTGVAIFQDVAAPCASMPDPWPCALPREAVTDEMWQDIRREWEELGFILWADGTLENEGDAG